MPTIRQRLLRPVVVSSLGGLLVLFLVWAIVTSTRRTSGVTDSQVFTNITTPVFFSRARPLDYAEQAFTRELREKLAPDEASLVINPLASTPEMDRWAKELTAAATNDLQKAKVLFDVLVTHLSTTPVQFTQPPTARQVFEAWNTSDPSFGCQDLAFLYVALARAAGINAYHVAVEEDCRGMNVLHGCAAVFIGGRALLVDPAYSSFGISHKRFKVLSDVQTEAVYLSGKQNLQMCRIASKLAPRKRKRGQASTSWLRGKAVSSEEKGSSLDFDCLS